MKKIIALFSLILGLSLQAQAAIMQVSLDKSTYQLNDLVKAELKIRDYSKGVSIYQFDLRYLLSALSLQNVVFGPYLATPVLQSFEFNPDDTLSVYELNTDMNIDLAALQNDNFTVATLTFRVLQTGQFDLNLFSGLLGDTAGNSIDDIMFLSSTIDVQGTEVPTPATALLLLPALFLLHRRKN